MPPAALTNAFDSSRPYENEDEEQTCRTIVQRLTEDQQEQAARSSYAYFVSSQCDDISSSSTTTTSRIDTAMKMARRHLVAHKGDAKKALETMIDTLQFREKQNMDDIRRAFDSSSNDDDDGHNLRSQIRSQIESELSKQAMIIRGFDNRNHALLIKFPRYDSDTDEESFFNAHWYMIERAIAVTECRSNGLEETCAVALNYADYHRNNLPPMKFVIRLVTAMQTHYPERLLFVVLVDAPLLLRGVWKIIRPFVDEDTRAKVKFVSGEKQKIQVLGPLISEDQAMPFLLPGGKLSSDVDVQRFLHQVPFHCSYERSL